VAGQQQALRVQRLALVQQLLPLPVTTLWTCWAAWMWLLPQWGASQAAGQPSHQQPTRLMTCWAWGQQHQQQQRGLLLLVAWTTCWALAWLQQQQHRLQQQTSWACWATQAHQQQQQQHLRWVAECRQQLGLHWYMLSSWLVYLSLGSLQA
jgi:hypothetical protein